MTTIDGQVSDGYERVADAFTRNFDAHGDVGAAFSLYVRGEVVVDLWGGVARADSATPWTRDTLQLVFSTTKGATAICAGILSGRGELDFDAPVATYWPEFAANGKSDISLRTVMSHQSGLPSVPGLSFTDVLAVAPAVEALAAATPLWEPGSAHGYHAVTYGWLVGEVVRRVTGMTLGQFFAAEVAAPLGLDFWIGLPESEESRVSHLVAAPPLADPAMAALVEEMMGPGTLIWRALTVDGAMSNEGGMGWLDFNDRPLHATEMPAANGITDARSLARMYAATVSDVDGVRLLGPATVKDMCAERSCGPDRVLSVESRFGTGFMLDGTMTPMLGPSSFGHAGAGGSLGFADPDAGVGFGYVMNQMGNSIAGDPRTVTLIDAVRTCVA